MFFSFPVLLGYPNNIVRDTLKYLRISFEYIGGKGMSNMPVKFTVSVVQVGNSLKITVPKELAAHLELKKGDKVMMWADNSHAVLEKKKNHV